MINASGKLHRDLYLWTQISSVEIYN